MKTSADLERAIARTVVRGDIVGALALLADMERSVGAAERAAVYQVRMQLLTALFKDGDRIRRDEGATT